MRLLFLLRSWRRSSRLKGINQTHCSIGMCYPLREQSDPRSTGQQSEGWENKPSPQIFMGIKLHYISKVDPTSKTAICSFCGYVPVVWKSNGKRWACRISERLHKHPKDTKRDGINRAKCILIDSRAQDRKKGRANDLDLRFIEAAIAKGCSYCGSTQAMMTMDRIDNSLGHIKGNVVAACYRCNVYRGYMLYEAWLLIVPGLRRAKELGLLEGWKPLGCRY